MTRTIFFILLLISFLTPALPQRAEDFQTVAEDGAWCWFSDPRSIYYKGNHART